MGIVGSGGGARGLGATQEQRERVDVKVEVVGVEAAQAQMSMYSTGSMISIYNSEVKERKYLIRQWCSTVNPAAHRLFLRHAAGALESQWLYFEFRPPL
jgi:hypothetical protein